MVDLLVVVALIVSKPDSTLDEDFAYLGPQIKAVAVTWELLDEREAKYILRHPSEFAPDVRMIQRRFGDLYDAPPAADAKRFPPNWVVNDYLAFNRVYRQHIDVGLSVDSSRWQELRNALQEVDQLYFIWDNVRDANSDYYYITVRRGALKRLRDLIGNEAYYTGDLPPFVPLWRFQEIR